MSEPSLGAGIRGTLLGFPLTALVWTEGGSLCWRGTLRIEGKGVHDLLEFVDPALHDPELDSLLEEIVGPISAVLDVEQTAGARGISLDTGVLSFRALSAGRSSAFVVALVEPAQPPSSPRLGVLLELVRAIRDGVGLSSLLLAYRSGTDLTLKQLQRGSAPVAVPPALSRASWLLLGKFVFESGSIAGRGMRDLLGITEIDLVAGIDLDRRDFAICLAVPSIENRYLETSGLYVALTLGASGLTFAFRGSFTFTFLKDLTFTASGSFDTTGFALSAEASAPEALEIPLLRGFYFGDVGLLIGFTSGGLTFGLFATLYARKLMMFGAVILSLKGEVPVPMLVSGAIGRVSIPSLFENFTGLTIEGLHTLDFLALDGLHFAFPKPFDTGVLAAGDKAAIAAFFNAGVGGASAFSLAAGELELRKLPSGYGLVDRQRMRHYFIDPSGQVFLQAQFYHSFEGDLQFGAFTVSPGLFFGGAIEVVGRRFELLFSLREGEGLFAYAKLDPIDLGILRISASEDALESPFRLPPTDLCRALVREKQDGLVFYLSASKREVTFYFDGRIELANLLLFDARVVYTAGNISVHTETLFLGVHALFALDVSYSSLLSANLGFRLSLDTKELLAGLTDVTRRIDEAIQALAKTIHEADQAIQDARDRVQQLNGEIDALDARIHACQKAIDEADFWAKPFVAIAKGVEIVAYEIAKAGVWAAIQIANAGLALAQKAVDLFGQLGEGVLSLVNATIRAASSLLFLRHVDVKAEVSAGHQSFSLDVAFVALGKEYRYQGSVDGDVLRGKLLPWLSEELNGLLTGDLDDLRRGQPRSRSLLEAPRGLRREADLPDLAQAPAQLRRAAGLFASMQERYRQELGEDLTDFDVLRTGFLSALQIAGNALHTASSLTPPPVGADLLSVLGQPDLGALSDEDRRGLEEAMSRVASLSDLRAAVRSASDAAAQARRDVTEPPRPRGLVAAAREARPAENADARMTRLLDELAEDVGRFFPAGTSGAGYIDLNREPKLADCFLQARSIFGPDDAPGGERARAPGPLAARGIDDYHPRLGD